MYVVALAIICAGSQAQASWFQWDQPTYGTEDQQREYRDGYTKNRQAELEAIAIDAAKVSNKTYNTPYFKVAGYPSWSDRDLRMWLDTNELHRDLIERELDEPALTLQEVKYLVIDLYILKHQAKAVENQLNWNDSIWAERKKNPAFW